MLYVLLAKGLNYPFNWIILILLAGFILWLILLPKLKKPKITELFCKKDSPYLYALCTAKSAMITKTGIIETYVIYWVKTDIKTQKRLYRTKITSFTAKMLEGYARVLGVTDSHTFIRTYGNGFFIINNADGKITATRKSIVRNNPDFKKVKADEYHFMPETGEVYIYDREGYLNQLDLNTLMLSKKGKYIAKNAENVVPYKATEPYYLARLSAKNENKSHNEENFYADIISSETQKTKKNRAKIHYIRKNNEKRWFVAYSEAKPSFNELKHDFISPKVITDAFNAVCIFGKEYPCFLVLHESYLLCKPHEMLVSCVKPNSETVWTHRADMLIHNPEFKHNAVIFAEEREEKLYFFCCTIQETNIISISVTESASGKIITAPASIPC
jgi:hypothetical protein